MVPVIDMQGYFSRTGTLQNLAVLRALDWGILICASKNPSRDHRDEGFDLRMLDNGAWKCRAEDDKLAAWRAGYRAGFELLVETFGKGARLVVLPDIVAGGADSLAQSLSWMSRLEGIGGLLLPVQDGMTVEDIEPHVGPELGIFVGGTDDPDALDGGWKWASLATTWGPLARRSGCHLHVGRAGSGRQVERCALSGAHSFDTSQPSRYSCKAPGLDNARRQMPLDWTQT